MPQDTKLYHLSRHLKFFFLINNQKTNALERLCLCRLCRPKNLCDLWSL